MKYKLETYGWEMETCAHSLSNEQVAQIEELMSEEGYNELWEARNDIEDKMGVYIWEPDMFHISKAMDNGTMYFYVKSEEGEIVTEFDIADTSDVYEAVPNIDDYDVEDYLAFPSEDENIENVLLVVDEYKGGIGEYYFESDEVPTAADFSYQRGSVATPDGDWDFISRIFFKGQELEMSDHLDNSGKASTLEIYTFDDRVIN